MAASTTRPAKEAWRKQDELTVRIDRIPQGTELRQLHSWFSGEGHIVYMDIDGHDASRSLSAKIRYQPPPSRAFWECEEFIAHGTKESEEEKVSLRVTRLAERPGFAVKASLLDLSGLDFGVMTSPSSFKVMKTLDNKSLSVEFDQKRRRLTIFFSFPVRSASQPKASPRPFKVVIDTSILRKVHFQTAQTEDTMTFVLLQPPQYYRLNNNVASSIMDEQQSWNVGEAWNRATDIVEVADSQCNYAVSLYSMRDDDSSQIDIGRWHTLRLRYRGALMGLKFEQMLQDLEQLNITIDRSQDFHVTDGDDEIAWKYLHQSTESLRQSSTSWAKHQLSTAYSLLRSQKVDLPFEVRYQLEVCISQGKLNEHGVSHDFLYKLAAMAPIRARALLEHLAEDEDVVHAPMKLLQTAGPEAYTPKGRIPHYCALMRKATITPTTIHFSTPTVETSNRVLRKYNDIGDRFLRVQFTEESGNGRIGSSTRPGDDDVWKRVLRALYRGIQIGDRRYEFLAFGNSQLRQHSALFFCRTAHVSPNDIRAWMGSFSHIKIAAKYAARVGQCLSTTRPIRGILTPTIRLVPDIETNGCHTDGSGMISKFLAKLIAEELELDIFDQPTAFQFRMGGCKGVLAVWPQAKGMEVCVRPSQEKFKAEFNGLEIVRCAKPATATLNRQTIVILESLGVRMPALLNLLDQELKGYDMAMTYDSVAIDLLTKFVDEGQTTLVMAEFLKAGFRDGPGELFVRNVVDLWRAWSLKLLKEKARIHVEKSAFVLGCADESRTLRGHCQDTEGSKVKDMNKLPQIFLQLSDTKRPGKTVIIRGVCVLGRNPSLHPGDIRVVQAVDNPRLHHLKDVVVFPTKGDRALAAMLSGGDLDGDDYFVIWEPSLIPLEWNHPPMDYSAPKPFHLDRDVGVNDLRNFFVNYMKKDFLGLIATAHLGFADEKGPKSNECLYLAELHSKAVDFPKTGEPAPWTSRTGPKDWPHFMEKRRSYRSRKALGVIYDRVSKQKTRFTPQLGSSLDERILNRFELKDDILNAARSIKKDYDIAVQRIMKQHQLDTEYELWTGFSMSKPAIGSDYKRQEDISRDYDAVKQRFREAVYAAAGGKSPGQLDPFVAAIYKTVEAELNDYQQKMEEDSETEETPLPPLVSFPWIFPWAMVRMALGGADMSRSMLAAARRTELRSVKPEKPSDAFSKDLTAASIHDNSAHLMDGTVVELGEPMSLFGRSDSSGSLGSRQEATAGEDEAIEDESVDGHGQNLAFETEFEEEEESALDRLAKLTGLGETE